MSEKAQAAAGFSPSQLWDLHGRTRTPLPAPEGGGTPGALWHDALHLGSCSGMDSFPAYPTCVLQLRILINKCALYFAVEGLSLSKSMN